MKKIIWNEKGFINITEEINGQSMALVQPVLKPVNPKAMPGEAAIYVDQVAFDRMCMDYVKAKGEKLLIEAAQRRPDKDTVLASFVSAATAAILKKTNINDHKLIAEIDAFARRQYEKFIEVR